MRKSTLALFVVAVLAAIGLTVSGPAGANTPVSGAGFTTVNEGVDGTGHCKNGNPLVNCNIYDGKQYVWLNGGPSTAYVGDGTYFFAVLDPGGQADPNDGALKNLSSPNDAYTNRTFTVTNGVVSYSGTHDFSDNKIRLMPYDDTSNPGGVYIMAICSLADGYPVDASACKYDAFKVQSAEFVTASDLTITKDANGADTNTFTWGISKDVDKTRVESSSGGVTFNYTVNVTHNSGTISGVQVTGTISVFNPNVDDLNNTVPVTIDGVSDQLSDGTVCDVTNGGSQTLTQFQTDFAYTCDLSALPQGELDNTAAVAWSDQLLSNGAFLNGNSADFTFKDISFDETKVDDCVDVTDTIGGTLGTVCSTDPSPTQFQYSNTVDGVSGTCTNYDNTATFTTDDTGATDSASKTVTLCRGADLQVSKDATASFKRTFHWGITKAVDKTFVRQLGGTATFNYTVNVTHDSGTASNWVVKGTITVTNPNDWEAITYDLADAVGGNGSCSIDGGGSSLTVAKSATKQSNYTCTYSSAPNPASDTNTATATWDSSTASTPDGTATGTAGFNFGSVTPTLVDNCVTVTDTYKGSLGTACNTDPSPKTFTYSRTVNVPSNTCNSYDNTATFTTNTTGTTGSAGKTVTVCGGVTGGLTMGFWQNKNGQGIITGGASTGGVCNSGTYLRGYAPFQDLASNASCSTVASYVYNIIKAANASGASMNAMLKAQMLATALDVYFSTPALGGNKINAPTPLGGVKVDLTAICKMIDSSSGSGTCSGVNSNASAAFGGATCLTVNAILTYAAGQSNSGGTAWYGQVKATQELAKNTFDAINNQVAFSCI